MDTLTPTPMDTPMNTAMPTPCFVFDLDDVLRPTTELFQNPHIQQVLRTMDTTSLTAVVQAYQSF